VGVSKLPEPAESLFVVVHRRSWGSGMLDQASSSFSSLSYDCRGSLVSFGLERGSGFAGNLRSSFDLDLPLGLEPNNRVGERGLFFRLVLVG